MANCCILNRESHVYILLEPLKRELLHKRRLSVRDARFCPLPLERTVGTLEEINNKVDGAVTGLPNQKLYTLANKGHFHCPKGVSLYKL